MTGQNPGATQLPLIEYKNVTLMRGNRKILDAINLSIEVGEHVAILGPNGAGKSSFIKTITRELHPVQDDGDSSIKILGKELWNLTELRNHLGIVGSETIKSVYWDFSCMEVVLGGFFASAGIWSYQEDEITDAMREKARDVMKLMRIYHLAETGISQTSTGEQRLVMIARSLVNDPLAMLLDEPTSNLDPQASRKVRLTMSKIARQGKGILMITHNLSDVIPEIERVVLIRSGKIFKDGKKEKLLTPSSLSSLFGGKWEIVKRDGYYYAW
jgi:iron complex transport system ATP-binding protein